MNLQDEGQSLFFSHTVMVGQLVNFLRDTFIVQGQ